MPWLSSQLPLAYTAIVLLNRILYGASEPDVPQCASDDPESSNIPSLLHDGNGGAGTCSGMSRSLLTFRSHQATWQMRGMGPHVLWTEEVLRTLSSSGIFKETVASMSIMDKDTTEVCSQRFGAAMIHGMQNTRIQLCAAQNSASSSVHCHQRIPFDIPRYTCLMQNIAVSAAGAQVVGCTATPDLPRILHEGGVMENDLFGEKTSFHSLKLSDMLQCKNKVEHQVLLQIPWDLNNFYEWYGDWVTLWETMAVLEWNPDDTEVYLLGNVRGDDGRPYKRVFDEAWSRAFAAKGVRSGTFSELFGEGTCFSQLAAVPHGGLSTFTFNDGRHGSTADCPSATLQASALYLRGLFPSMAASTKPEAAEPRRVTLLLRSKGSHRAFEDDAATQAAATSALPAGWMLELLRPETLSLAEQIAAAGRTQVLVGTHGAGLTLALFLPPRARLVEVYCGDRNANNGHYRTLEGMAEPATGELQPKTNNQFHFSSDYEWECFLYPKLVRDAIEAYNNEQLIS